LKRFQKLLGAILPKAEIPAGDVPSLEPSVAPAPDLPNQEKEDTMSTDISGLKDITAFLGGCLVDSDTGLMLASEGGNGALDLEVAGAMNTEVVKAKLAAMNALQLDDSIEDILITLGKQYHLIRPLEQSPTVFLYVALDKKTANLGMARIQVKKVEKTLSL
jgi:predicted regulator of Ras-like GTPase activity (Roadblock/LC7/MglB family)